MRNGCMKSFSECPISDLHHSLDYDSETGGFTRKINASARGSLISRWHGKPTAYSVTSEGYLRVSVGTRQYLAHRVAWAMVYGEWPTDQIDHINHIRHDNRISNLRVVSDAENRKNMKLRTDNGSGVAGVTWRSERKKWRARVQVAGKGIFLGNFDSIDDAIKAREMALIEHNFHSNHGK